MNILHTPLEEACKFLLQKNISFEVNNKVFKSGKLILFYQKNFFIMFIIQTNKKERDKIEIPIPYEIESHNDEGLLYFDYRIKTLSRLAPEMENYLKIYPTKFNCSKYWDNILTIKSNE
jgi:hypothetical protein